jgi:hypothetical protein
MRAAAIRQQSDPSPRNESDKVLENELDQLQRRVLEAAKGEFFFDVTRSAKEFILLKGSQQSYGAQHLKLSLERHVVYPTVHLNLLFSTQFLLANGGLAQTCRMKLDSYKAIPNLRQD